MVIGVKTVYRHPKGRFEVRETTHHAFGNTYTVREAFLTPDEDRRRLPEAMRIRQSTSPKTTLSRFQSARRRGSRSCTAITSRSMRSRTAFWKIAEIREAKDMVKNGYSLSEIARQLGRTESSVQSCMNSKRWREVEAR